MGWNKVRQLSNKGSKPCGMDNNLNVEFEALKFVETKTICFVYVRENGKDLNDLIIRSRRLTSKENILIQRV